MRTFLLILSLLAAAASISVAQTSSIKLNQTFSSREINSIDVDIKNPNLQVKTIKGSIIVVEISIEISSTNFRLLEFVADKGRYNILGKFDKENNLLKNAPHIQADAIADDWAFPYTRKEAVMPLDYLKEFKYWAHVSRVENAYGDRNLICSCPGIEEYQLEEA